MPSSEDVAQLAGVSRSTVSRVVSGDPRISKATADKVRKAIRQTGYTPPSAENDGRRKRSRSRHGIYHRRIVLLFPDTHPEAIRTILSARLMMGMEQEARRHGLSLIVTGLPSEQQLPSSINPRQIDGVIVRGFQPWLEQPLSALPTCWLLESSRQARFGDQVMPDNIACGTLAFEYLHDQRNRRKLAIVISDEDHASFAKRAQAFLKAADDAGLEVASITMPASDQCSIVDQLRRAMPDGVFCTGDEARLVSSLVEQLGCSAGNTIDVIGCDHRLDDQQPPIQAIANIDIQPESIGQAAIQTLLWRQANLDAAKRRVTIQPKFSPAQSTREVVS